MTLVERFLVQRLEEGSKERFLKPALGNEAFYQPLLKWVDSGAADKLKIDWQKFGKDSDERKRLVAAFKDYQKEGGSRKEKETAKKDDPNQVFLKSGLKVCVESDTTGQDMCIMKSLETDQYIFVVPLTWEAAKWMDSFACGGEGARWCIGYEDSDGYWNDYIRDGSLFCLAFNKEAYKDGKNRKPDTLKYMLQISVGDDDPQAWVQNDEPSECIPSKKWQNMFGRNIIELTERISETVFADDNDYVANMELDYQESFYNFDEMMANEDIFGRAFTSDTDIYYFGDIAGCSEAEAKEKVLEKLDQSFDEVHIDFRNNIVDNLPKFISNRQDFDVASLWNWLEKITGKKLENVELFLENGDFNTVSIEYEAGAPYTNFVRSSVDWLCYTDYSQDGRETVFDEHSSLRMIEWPEGYEDGQFSCGTESLRLNGQDPEETWQDDVNEDNNEEDW